jgi:hypothetical protein
MRNCILEQYYETHLCQYIINRSRGLKKKHEEIKKQMIARFSAPKMVPPKPT